MGEEEKDDLTLETLQNNVLSLTEQIKSLQEKNEKLSLHNQQLFLKVTKENNIDNIQETKDKEYIDYVGEEFYNSLTNKQKKQLIEILEGEDE